MVSSLAAEANVIYPCSAVEPMFFSRSICFTVFCFVSGFAQADDWPQWRGTHRNAELSESEQVAKLPTKIVKRKWTAKIGSGYSGPSVANGRVYVTDRGEQDTDDEVERVLCFDAKTGKPIWEHEYAAPYSIGYRAGPRAAVTIHDGMAYCVGAMGHFHCLNAEDGSVFWKRDLGKDYDVRMPIWGITASPLVYHDLVIQIAAGNGNACVVALDAKTGKERWRALNERAGYSAPILIQQGEHDVVVALRLVFEAFVREGAIETRS